MSNSNKSICQIQIHLSKIQINKSLVFIAKLIRKAEIQCLSNYVLPINAIMEWNNEHYKFFVINMVKIL